jgi:acyl-coenzyme A synthetase/AMP-(fatty) acid ligase
LIFGIQSPLYFDAWLKELLGVIVKGATAYLLPRELFVNPVSLIQYINERQINALCWVSSAFSLVSRLRTFYAVVPEHLKLMCFGSEVLPVKQLTAWQKACPDARVFQLYGATECTGMSFYHPVAGPQDPAKPVPVGKPFPSTRLYLLDDEGQPSKEGEIVIGGPCVMAGYYKDPVRTAAALIPDPADPEHGELCYRTGDHGRLDENGDLIFVGRRDQQIKHMGHRVELGEIEAAALSLKGVHEAVCMYVADRQRIDLFYTGPAQPWDLVVGLKVKLPGYMTPSRTEQRSELPHLPNGKIDRRAIEQKEYGK